MSDIIIYQLEVGCCLAVFYLFYKFLLHKSADLVIIRFFIISAVLVAFTLPGLNIRFDLQAGDAGLPVDYLSLIAFPDKLYVSPPVPSTFFDPWVMLSWLWGVGFVIMLVRLLISLISVQEILNGSSMDQEGKSFRITNAKVQSFSFFKAIVLSRQHYRSEAMKYILAHEQAHSRQYHSLDVLFIETLKLFQWFNPFAWLMARAAMQNIEYLADREVVNSLKNEQEYQLAIVQFAHHAGHKLLRSEFSKSNLKNRIIMMHKRNYRTPNKGKLLFILPLVGILFLAFSIKVERLDIRKKVNRLIPLLNLSEQEHVPLLNEMTINRISERYQVSFQDSQKIMSEKNSEITKSSIDDLPGLENVLHAEVKNKRGTNLALASTERIVKGKVLKSESGEPIAGANIIITGTATGTISDAQGNFQIKVKEGQTELLFTLVGRIAKTVNISNKDQLKVTLKVDKNYREIVEIENELDEKVDIEVENEWSVNIRNELETQDGKEPLVIIGDKETSLEGLESLHPSDIESIHVLKADAAVKKYGQKAKHGVIIIKLKEQVNKN